MKKVIITCSLFFIFAGLLFAARPKPQNNLKTKADFARKIKQQEERIKRLEDIILTQEKKIQTLKKTIEQLRSPQTSSHKTKQHKTKALNSKNIWGGVRGLKWGTNIANTSGMVLIEEIGDNKAYRRQDESLEIGSAELTSIVYHFYKNRFFSVMVESKGFLNGRALKSAVFARYGKGYQPNEFIEQWAWGGRFGVGSKNVEMILGFNEFTEKSTLFFIYIPISNEQKKDDVIRAKEASRDF